MVWRGALIAWTVAFSSLTERPPEVPGQARSSEDFLSINVA